MLLTIHNLPLETRYADIKALIKDKCGLTDLIVDNLVIDGRAKKVTVGLADEGDAAMIVRKINGLYIHNRQLFVEDVRQKTSDQPYRPTNQYNHRQTEMEFQPQAPTTSHSEMASGSTAPNFGLPFYMTAQNQNVGNNPQYMVQYPIIHGSMGNEPNDGRDVGFEPQYGRRNEGRPLSPDRDSHRERSPRRVLIWSEQDSARSGSRRSDRQSRRDDRLDDDQSYRDMSRRNTRSNQDYGSNNLNNSRFEKPIYRSEPLWEDPDRSTYRKQNEPYRYDDTKKYNTLGRHNQEREAQKFRENSNTQSRGFDSSSRPTDFPKKRAYESTDKNKFCPQNKKFGSNQQFQSRKQQDDSGSSSSNNYHKKKFAPRTPIQQYRPREPPKDQQVVQKDKPQWQQNEQPAKQFKKQHNVAKNRPALPEEPIEDIINRHQAWRIQASAVIATQILVNVGRMPNNRRDPLLLALKACVRARIDVIVGDDYTLTLREILYNYRQKFHDDDVLCNTVWDQVQSREVNQPDGFKPGKKATEEAVDKKKSGNPNAMKPQDQPPVGKPAAKAQTSGSTERLPKYPDGNKKALSQLKKTQKEEILNESLYNLNPEHDKALKEELDIIDELIKMEIDNPQNDTEKAMSNFMNDVFIPDLRKILTLHVKKRVLDIRTNLSVRVMCHFKVPRRNVLDAFLKDYGVVSLKVSDKNRHVLIAICDSYKNYDALCKKSSAMIDNLRIMFKPLHLTGPPINKRDIKQSAATNVTENNSENDDVNKNKEMRVENLEKNNEKNSEVTANKTNTKVQENEGSECEFISYTKSQDASVVEDGTIKLKEITIMHDDDVNTSDKTDVVLDEPTQADGNVPTDAVNIDAGKAAVANDNEELIQADDIMDDDNIDDEDLEDF